MDIRVESFQLRDFRNYETFRLDGIGPLTIFIGPNGIGKTNVLESIQLLTATPSFRHAHTQELIRWDAENSLLKAHMVSDVRDLEIGLAIGPTGKTYSINGKKHSGQDVQTTLPSVVFSPDDMLLLKGSQSYRRDELDAVGCQLSKNHRILKRDYLKLMKHKNALLKDGVTGPYIESVNDLIVPTATQLYLYRVALFKNIAARMTEVYATISAGGERLEMRYIPSWHPMEVSKDVIEDVPFDLGKQEISTRLEEALHQRAVEEYERGRGLVGPHADKIMFYLNGRNASLYGSQGQQRSISLAWKIAEVGLIEEILGQKPVLLLDDVASELDAARRGALVELLHRDIQTFITTTDIGTFESEVVDEASVVNMLELRNK
ncbi:DNA replication/repair protein RecF [Slackia heliotrinireducens]|uniref:DNA replication/repair protein RecF n=1 Tax=Slackia heliotrinireducens TaxID=84110 RepID=UPI0033160AB6